MLGNPRKWKSDKGNAARGGESETRQIPTYHFSLATCHYCPGWIPLGWFLGRERRRRHRDAERHCECHHRGRRQRQLTRLSPTHWPRRRGRRRDEQMEDTGQETCMYQRAGVRFDLPAGLVVALIATRPALHGHPAHDGRIKNRKSCGILSATIQIYENTISGERVCDSRQNRGEPPGGHP